LRPLPLLAVAFVGLTAIGGLVARGRREPALPDLGALPGFSLTDHRGRTLTGKDLAGGPWIADFIFTRCGATCPAMTSRLSRLRKEVPAAIRFVSFTVDPGHDTAEVLAAYARDFRADDRWSFVTGSQTALHALATEGFKLAALELLPDQRKPGDDGPFLHSAKFVLVDGVGRIRGYYDSADEGDVRTLAGDVRRLAGEPGTP